MDANTDIPEGTEPLRDRQETFSQIYSLGVLPAGKAYVKAGYSEIGADQAACKLLRNTKIIARVAYLRAKAAEKHEVTRETIASEAEQHRKAALADNNHAAANGALVIKARAYGLQTDKVVTEQDNSELTAEREADARLYAKLRMSPQWDALVASVMGEGTLGHGGRGEGRTQATGADRGTEGHVIGIGDGSMPPTPGAVAI